MHASRAQCPTRFSTQYESQLLLALVTTAKSWWEHVRITNWNIRSFAGLELSLKPSLCYCETFQCGSKRLT